MMGIWIRICGCLLAVILSLGFNATVSAEEPSPSPPVQQPAQSPKSSIHAVTQAAVNAGVLSCAKRINQVANFLGSGSKGFGAQLYVPAVEPDRNLLTVSFEIQTEGMETAYASAIFAPNQANDCGAMYETVMYWPMKCDDVAVKQFSGLRQIGAMRKDISVLDGGPALKVYLMPAGGNCIAIKKEVVQ